MSIAQLHPWLPVLVTTICAAIATLAPCLTLLVGLLFALPRVPKSARADTFREFAQAIRRHHRLPGRDMAPHGRRRAGLGRHGQSEDDGERIDPVGNGCRCSIHNDLGLRTVEASGRQDGMKSAHST